MFRRSGRDGFEDLLAPHIDYLYRLAYRFSGKRADAEDLVQDLLLKLYPRRHEMNQLAPLRPWLVRALYHHYIDTLRSQRRNPLHEALDMTVLELTAMPAVAQPEHAVENASLQHRLVVALASLNPDQRTLIALHDIEGYTLVELQTMLDIPIGTLKSRLHRARAQLREQLVMEPFSSSQRYYS